MLRRLVANCELKILSVVIAFALWLVVAGSGKSQLATPAIVEYTGLGADLVLVGRPRDSVQVELEASRWAVARLTPGAVRARVSVAGMHEGENVAALSPDLVEAPPGVTVRRRSEEHTSELQSRFDLVCRLLLEKKNKNRDPTNSQAQYAT